MRQLPVWLLLIGFSLAGCERRAPLAPDRPPPLKTAPTVPDGKHAHTPSEAKR